MRAALGVLFFIVGTIFGSFANVVIYRLPKKMSLVHPPSSCPKCGTPIKWFDNIPLISYLLLSARCRYCKNEIPLRYFLIELSSGLLFLFSYFFAQSLIEAVLASFFYLYLLIVLAIDLEHRIIPDKLNYSFFLLSIFTIAVLKIFKVKALPLVGEKGLAASVVGIILITAFFLIVDFLSYLLFKKPGIGLGDVKMGLNIGLYLGYYAPLVPLIAYAVAAFFTPLLLKKHNDGYIPFGPFLSVSSFIISVFGPTLVNLYVKITGLVYLF